MEERIVMIHMTWDIGVYVSIASIGFTILLTGIVIKLDRNRRKREEEFYVDHVRSCVQKISNYFREIDERSNFEDMDEDSDEVIEQILRNLRRYYKQNYDEMETMRKDIQKSLRHWRSIDTNTRSRYQDIVDEFAWLTNKYFQMDENEKGQQARWYSYHKQLTDKRYKIDRWVELLIK